MASSLFGTDGIRGPAGVGPLSPVSLTRLGVAIARTLERRAPRALIARDPRRSGAAVQAALTAGLLGGGVIVDDAGVLPTPGLALLTRLHGYDLGIMISASHNAWPDNGVKIVGPGGGKLDAAAETQIEQAFHGLEANADCDTEDIALAGARPEAAQEYMDALCSRFGPTSLDELLVVADTGHGALSAIARPALKRLGSRVTLIHGAPDGMNINAGCGATETAPLQRMVQRMGADAGAAFDGDADRVQLCDEDGRLIDGDAILAGLAPRLLADGKLPHATVVGTLMTNGALEVWLNQRGIRLVRTDVGDKYIVREMREHGYALGAEPSGHVILERDGLFTGDGLYAAMACLEVITRERIQMSAFTDGFEPWPLALESFRVRERTPIAQLAQTRSAIAAAEERLAESGRVVVRYSGTEPKVRVMVEAREREDLDAALAPIVAALRTEVGE